MKKIDLAQGISILANVGVIAGIVFLGLELRQVQDQLEAEISFNRFSEELAARRTISTTPELAGAIAKHGSGEALTLEESVMLDSYTAGILVQAEYAWQQSQSGRSEFRGLPELARRINTDFWGMSETWDRMKQVALDPAFVNAVNRELEE